MRYIVNAKRSQSRPENAETLFELDAHLKYRVLPYTVKKSILAQLWGKYTCFYCAENGDKGLAIDHIVPSSQGGGYRLWNNALACFDCNAHKSDLDVAALHKAGKVKLADALATLLEMWTPDTVPRFGFDPESLDFREQQYDQLQKFRATTEFGIAIQDRLEQLQLSYCQFKKRYAYLNGGAVGRMMPEKYITGQALPKPETLRTMLQCLEWQYADIQVVYEAAYLARHGRKVGPWPAKWNVSEPWTETYRDEMRKHYEARDRARLEHRQEIIAERQSVKLAYFCDRRQYFIVSERHAQVDWVAIQSLHAVGLGIQLTEKMREKEMSIADLARETGIVKDYLIKILEGANFPGALKLAKLAAVLEIPLSKLRIPNTRRT